MLQTSVSKILTDFELWRKSQGLTQQEVAEKLDVTRPHLNKVLNQKTPPSIQLLEKMEKMINNS